MIVAGSTVLAAGRDGRGVVLAVLPPVACCGLILAVIRWANGQTEWVPSGELREEEESKR